MNANGIRLFCTAALASAAVALTACGGSDKPPAPAGSPGNPLVAQQTGLGGTSSGTRSNEAAARSTKAKPGYESLVKKQSSHPRSIFTPCNLVTAAQARAIVGAPVLEPLEAAQGPTCVYRTKNGKSFVTVSVQALDFNKLKRQMHVRQRVAVADHTAYCGTYGQPMLYVPLSRGRVLSVGAHCAIAKQFAIRALRQF